MSKELLTLQLGNFSNFVGTHWWNIQEASFVYHDAEDKYSSEINHDILFREGVTLKGEVTYTPRLISVDLKDGINHLKQHGVLYDVESDNDTINWSHEVTIHKEDSLMKKNEFLKDLDISDNPDNSHTDKRIDECPSREEMEVDTGDDSTELKPGVFRTKLYNLDDCVATWSDYLRLHLHPRTLSIVKNYSLADDSFNVHGYGQAVYRENLADDIEDKIHFFTEEADHLQGFHVISDIYNGFGGVSTSVCADIMDEFPKKGCLVFCPLQNLVKDTPVDESSPQNDYELINTVISMSKLVSAGCCVTPLGLTHNPWSSSSHATYTQLPNITYKSHLPYHTSAILAAALDTATLSHRLANSLLPLSHLTDVLTAGGRKISSLSINFPLSATPNKNESIDLIGKLFNNLQTPWVSLTPLFNVNTSEQIRVQSVISRGSTSGGLLLPQIYKRFPGVSTCVYELSQPCNTQAPFPHIFDNTIDESGYLAQKSRPPTKGVSKVGAMTSLSSTDDSYPMLSYLLNKASKLSQKHLQKHMESSLELDDWSSIINDMRDLSQLYTEKELSSDDTE